MGATINLEGHTIDGGNVAGNNNNGIVIAAHTDYIIKNGIINGFSNGITSNGTGEGRVEIENVQVSNSADYGVFALGSMSIHDSYFFSNGTAILANQSDALYQIAIARNEIYCGKNTWGWGVQIIDYSPDQVYGAMFSNEFFDCQYDLHLGGNGTGDFKFSNNLSQDFANAWTCSPTGDCVDVGGNYPP